MTPIEYENLTREEIDFVVTNDCGGHILDVADLIFDQACWEHDTYYWAGGLSVGTDRKAVDLLFYYQMKNIVNALPWYKRWKLVWIEWWLPPVPLRSIPWIYYNAVRIGGSTGYSDRKHSYEDLVHAMTLADHYDDLPDDWDQNVPNSL